MIAVIGAGAAGLMAALHAAGRGRRVVLLERTSDGGRKILISGGGRCNVLPSRLDPRDYITDSSPNVLRRILHSWPLPEQIRFFEEVLGSPLVLEEETGKLFPRENRARAVRDALVREALRRGVEIRFGVEVTGIAPASRFRDEGVGERGAGEGWIVSFRSAPPPGTVEAASRSGRPTGGPRQEEAGPGRAGPGRDPAGSEGSAGTLECHALILATGGLSVPATGSDGTGLRILETLGHTVRPPYPALTPLTEESGRHAPLAGVSLPVRIREEGRKGRVVSGGFLFTHRGFSGPTVLNLSDLAVRSLRGELPPPRLRVLWTGEEEEVWDARLREGRGTVGGALRRALPQRLADALAEEAGVPVDRSLAQLPRASRRALVERLAAWPLPWTGDEGYRKAEVTGGGVRLEEVNPGTLESRRHPGLFLCGELLDAFGPIGGYNFAWAWATGRLAGLGASGGALPPEGPRDPTGEPAAGAAPSRRRAPPGGRDPGAGSAPEPPTAGPASAPE